MDTAIIITGFIGLAAGLALGRMFREESLPERLIIMDQEQTIAAQAEEIDALNKNNLRLRGQCTELATQAHDANELKEWSAQGSEAMFHLLNSRDAELVTTKRKLSAAKGQITKLRKAMGVEV